MILIEFRVIEYYDQENAPEDFGSFYCEKPPAVDDIIMLKWLDGRDAYPVKVDRVEDWTLHVTKVPDSTL